MSEKTEVEKPCVALALSFGYLHYKFDRPGGKKGWPDAAFWGPNGEHFLVEFKRPGKKPSKLQHYWLQRFSGSGHGTYVVRSVEDFREVLADQRRFIPG